MRIPRIFPFILFVCVCLVLFSGQQRRQPQRPVTDKPAATLPATLPARPPVKDEPAAPTAAVPAAEKSVVPLLFLTPETIRLPSTEDGRNHTITLMGDPRKDRLYVTRTVFPKGRKTPPHTHTDSRTVVVLQGTYYYGVGSEFNEKKMIALPPGSFFTEPAGEPHYTWAKDGEVVVQTTAVGPSGTYIIPEAEKAEGVENQGTRGGSRDE